MSTLWNLLTRDEKAAGMDMDPLPDHGPAKKNEEGATTSSEFSFEAEMKALRSDLEAVRLRWEARHRVADISRLKAMTFAERNAREDHLWGLREDPSLFAEAMQECADHRQEMLLDFSNQKHPTRRHSKKPLFWSRVLGQVVVEAYFDLAKWDEIVKQVKNLETLYVKHKATLISEEDPPAELMDAFTTLQFILNATKDNLLRDLKVGLYSSPRIREFFRREPERPSTKALLQYSPPTGNHNHAIHRVMTLFNKLFQKQERWGLDLAASSIYLSIAFHDAVRELISPWVVSRLSTLDLVSKCLRELRRFEPWASESEGSMEKKQAELRNTYEETFRDWTLITSITFEGTKVYRYADPTDGKYNYPVHQPRNKQNVEALRKAEAHLDAFWEQVDTHYKNRATGPHRSRRDAIAHLLNRDHPLQRTPPWVDPEDRKAPAKKVEYVYRPFSSVFTDHSKQITGSLERASLSGKGPSKAKIRGKATPTNEVEPAATPDPEEAINPEQKFIDDNRAYQVFKALFHTPGDPDPPDEITWPDFVHAMDSISFSAEKLHGSAWIFTPNSLDIGIDTSIQFHEPHPRTKIPFQCARRFAKRLSRTYGLKGDFATCAIAIKNIPFAFKKKQLVQIMTDLRLPVPYAFNYHHDHGIFRGEAFANFNTPEEVAQVIDTMNHFELPHWYGRKLRVEQHRPILEMSMGSGKLKYLYL
jgi:hypothetical protein